MLPCFPDGLSHRGDYSTMACFLTYYSVAKSYDAVSNDRLVSVTAQTYHNLAGSSGCFHQAALDTGVQWLQNCVQSSDIFFRKAFFAAYV